MTYGDRIRRTRFQDPATDRLYRRMRMRGAALLDHGYGKIPQQVRDEWQVARDALRARLDELQQQPQQEPPAPPAEAAP